MPARSAPIRPRPGRPKSLQKHAAILDAARRLFLDQGYEGTRMEQIAAEAGVSKLTVYNHFGDKDDLFFAAIESRCLEQVPDALFDIASGTPMHLALREIALKVHALMTSIDSIALHRMLLSDRDNAERLGALFWEAGPARIQAGVEAFLREAVQRGELQLDDVSEAAGQLLCLLEGDIISQHLLGGVHCGPELTPVEHVDSALRFFLRAYAPRDESSKSKKR